MSATAVRACLRCHAKKIKCSGFPDCRNCANSGVACERHTRPRRTETVESLRKAHQRIKWLEDELQRHFQIDCRGVATGTPLSPRGRQTQQCSSLSPTSATAAILTGLHGANGTNGAGRSVFLGIPARTPSDASAMSTSPQVADDVSNDAPEISLLALNATGETKYLGPSSGAFFATYATRLARSLLFNGINPLATPNTARRRQPPVDSTTASPSVTINTERSAAVSLSTPQTVVVSPAHVRLLFQSYLLWVHPLYPLFQISMLNSLATLVGQPEDGIIQDAKHCTDMAMFHLIMALGATNYANTLKHLQQLQQDANDVPSAELDKPPSPPHLYYAQALHYFDQVVQNEDHMETSIAVIQIIVLISIYSSYGQGPIGSSQWQLAGLAMRMAMEIGLHHEPRQPLTPSPEYENVRDQRRRVFWTAYVIEISLAYNLGRPPSIGEEHITVRLPNTTKDSALGIHHIRHRQIQSRIVSHVYAGGRVAMSGTSDAVQTITRLQGELDTWRAELPTVLRCAGDTENSDDTSPLFSYPPLYWERLYHGTSFVLHRASPLSPQPPPASLEQCVRAAGAYLDCMLEVVRHSHVPLSWMLVQGVLFAGLSMLITARTRFQTLAQHAAETVRLLLVDLPMWTRRCSICLAVMNERWSMNRSRNGSEEDLLSQLERQFEALAGDTLSLITATVLESSTTTSMPPTHANTTTVPLPTLAEVPAQTDADMPSCDAQLHQDILHSADPALTGVNDWDHLRDFREFLGIDGAYTFWDVFPTTDDDFSISGTALGSDAQFPPW